MIRGSSDIGCPEAVSEAEPDTGPPDARRLIARQMLILAPLLAVSALVNTYSVLTDRAREGHPLPLWAPLIWESSSNFVWWLLIPAFSWWFARRPIERADWWRNLPAHLLATVPFSLLHVGGMVSMRKLAYWAAGRTYDFGPFWDNWLYEYRKDCVSYCLFLGLLLAFRARGLRLTNPVHQEDAPVSRLVVRKRNREFILDADDIDRLEADGNYVVVHATGQSYRLRDSLDRLARRLGEQRFARVHRTHVVNIERIREIQPWDHGDYRILLKDGSFLNFSRRYRSRLSHWFR
jgi:hypothetical protein